MKVMQQYILFFPDILTHDAQIFISNFFWLFFFKSVNDSRLVFSQTEQITSEWNEKKTDRSFSPFWFVSSMENRVDRVLGPKSCDQSV